jgi:hypothetical protein
MRRDSTRTLRKKSTAGKMALSQERRCCRTRLKGALGSWVVIRYEVDAMDRVRPSQSVGKDGLEFILEPTRSLQYFKQVFGETIEK